MTVLSTRRGTSPASEPFDLAACLARQALYRFMAAALADPRSGSWEHLSDPLSQRLFRSAATLIRQLKAAIAEPLSPGERPLADLHPAALLARLPSRQAELNAEYERTFGLLSVGPCPACETEYIHGKLTFQRSQGLADANGFYAAFGLARGPRHFERPDHISLQLEFMARLLGLERAAEESSEDSGRERAEVCRLAQARFLREHLAWWAPALARLLTRENSAGYYAAVGNFLAALIPAERAMLGVEANDGFAQPTKIEVPEECEGCSLAGEATGPGS